MLAWTGTRHFVARVHEWDRRTLAAAVRWRRPWLTPIVLTVTNSGLGVVWFSVGGFLALMCRVGVLEAVDVLPVLGAMLGALGSLIVGQGIKRVVQRPRPFVSVEGHEVLGPRPSDLSMPSTHSSTAVALFSNLLWIGHPAAPILGAWAAGVVLSRLYLGVHFPSDLIAGSLLGVVFGLLDFTPVASLVLG